MIGFIGGGNMAEALIKGMVQSSRFKAAEIVASEPEENRRKHLEQAYGIKTISDNKEAVSLSDIIILAVKPQNMAAVLNEIATGVTDEKTVVSIAAGIPLSYLSSKLKTKRLIRVMPNTPAIVQQGMSVMSLCECFSDKDIGMVREIFMSVGKVIIMPEKYMNAVTALSGSGPAFIAFFVEAIIEAGAKMGLRHDSAAELAVQTLVGTAALLDTGMSPEKLREKVTSPGGTTAAGLKIFEEKNLKDIIYETMLAALKRAEELGNK